MSEFEGFNSDILNDFVTESRELIETMDQDLVSLEQRPSDGELLNAIFRAMHTIKGSSSFLSLEPITRLAHAAEDAMNTLRKADGGVTADTMDLLLKAVDILRRQISHVSDSQDPEKAPDNLITALKRIGEEGTEREIIREDDQPASDSDANDSQTLELGDSKKDILPFMVEDMTNLLDQLAGILENATADNLPAESVALVDLSEQLRRCAEFFEIAALTEECTAIDNVNRKLSDLKPDVFLQVLPRLAALTQVIHRRAIALGELKLLQIDSSTLRHRLRDALEDKLSDDARLDEHAEAEWVLQFDGVDQPEKPQDKTESQAKASQNNPAAGKQVAAEADSSNRSADRTIRVDVDRLEALLNLVGELVLQKNRVLGLGKRMAAGQLSQKTAEELSQVGSDLDQITSDLQVSVMKTRMQPLNKLFNRYPRVIRDIARSMNKQIDLKMTGGETEVDKSVIESLGDPLVHILRNSADHGVEDPEKRKAAGKTPTGTISLGARHEGNHVLVTIADDGKGLDLEKIKNKAIERGLITADAAKSMSNADLNNLIFAPGLSTAEKISDVSGRGVGMDVVRTNIARLNGIVTVESQIGVGTTVSIRIPLTVAIMPAMMVVIGQSMYAIPLSNIREIVKPEEKQKNLVAGQPVMRLRDSVLPLIDMATLFDGYRPADAKSPIAVIVALGERNMGLLVDGLIGQEEIVIKPLDDHCAHSAFICGATVREDGGVSLIIDISELFKVSSQSLRKVA